MIFNKNLLDTEIFRYLVTGVLANLIYFFLYSGLFKLGLHIVFVTLFSYSICLIFTYTILKNWTFSPKNLNNKHDKLSFVIVYLSSGIIMTSIITFLVNHQYDYRIAWLAGTNYAIIHNYLLSKFYVFR